MSISILADTIVEKSKDVHSAIIGREFIHGVGKVTVFTDLEAREAWEAHVKPLKDKGHILALSSKGEPVSIVWGRR